MANPLCWLGGIVILVSVGALARGIRRGREWSAFLGSNFLIFGMLATGGAALYPVMLYSTLAPEDSLRADQVASTPDTLLSAAVWWPIAFVLTLCYFLFISIRYSGKVSVHRDNQGYY